MANIYTVKDGGDYHFDDPNAWEGGVVPGPSDTAFVRYQFTQINSGSGIHHWTGTTPSIRVDSTQHLPDSGSFYTYLRPGVEQIKIDYESKDGTNLYSCSIDQSYTEWRVGTSGSNIGYIRNDTAVHTKPTTVYLSGSATWEVMRVVVEDRGEFKMQDQATLLLNSTSGDSYVNVQDGIFTAVDEVTCAITGSSRRNSSFIHDGGQPYSTILISGSSDPRLATNTTAAISSGSSTIPIQDSSQFEEGDIISLYTLEDMMMYANPIKNNAADYYQYVETGSIYPTETLIKYLDEDETVQVSGKGTNELYVKKLFGKEGEVIASTNETRGSFQSKYKKVAKSFAGHKTSVTVRSGHNSFKAGDKLVIGSNLYTVLEATKKLIPHKTVDFSQGAGLEDFFVDEMIGSGSDDSYKVNSHMKSGSFLTLDKELVSTNSYYRSFYLKNTKLRDAKITISGSMIDESGSYDSNRMIGVSFGDEAYERDRRIPFYDRQNNSQECYIGVYGQYLRFGRLSHDGNYADTRNFEEYSGVDTTQNSFEVCIDRFQSDADFYYNGDYLGRFIANYISSDVGIHLRREGALFNKLIVEEYVQELLLDTSNSIQVGDKLYEGGTLVDHPANQPIVKLASTIKDLRGYTDIAAQRSLGNISGSIVPLFWSNQGDRTYYRNSETNDRRTRMSGIMQAYPWTAEFATKSGGDQYFDINLTEAVTFDAIGLSNYYAVTNAYIKGIGIEVSDDGHTWTVVRAQADDLRLGNHASAHRIYRISETTARFIRIRCNGTSSTSNNYFYNLSIHHFNGRGASIELNNAADFPVGAKLQFVFPEGYSNRTYAYARYAAGGTDAYINGTKEASELLGSPYPHYVVTAKNGNVVTLDREVEGEYLVPNTLVLRVDRPLKVKSGGTYPLGLYYGSTSSNPRKTSIYNTEALSLGYNNRERNYLYFASQANSFKLVNCSLNYLRTRDPAVYLSSMVWKNNILSNSTSDNLFATLRHSDSVIHGNVVNGYYQNFYNPSTKSTYVTGNLILAGRRSHIQGTSITDGPIKKSVFRNNHITMKDYFQLMYGHERDFNSVRTFEFYSNTTSSGAGYFRVTKQAQASIGSGRQNSEWPEYYPAVKANKFYRSSQSGFSKGAKMGSPAGGLFPVFRDPDYGYRSHLTDVNQVSIIKRLDSNEYDISAIHLLRTNGIVFKTEFEVQSEQEIKISADIDYYNDPFIRENDYGRADHPTKLFLLDSNKQTITARTLPYQDEYSKFEFTHTFTAPPGLYSLLVVRRHGTYGGQFMTFRTASSVVMGNDPDNLEIYSNTFMDYMALQQSTQMDFASNTGKGMEAMKNNPNRTTVKFRKIKF